MRFPACVPSYLACNAVAKPVMNACGIVTMGAAMGICSLLGELDEGGLLGLMMGFLCIVGFGALMTPAYAICAGPAYILTGCPLASVLPIPDFD